MSNEKDIRNINDLDKRAIEAGKKQAAELFNNVYGWSRTPSECDYLLKAGLSTKSRISDERFNKFYHGKFEQTTSLIKSIIKTVIFMLMLVGAFYVALGWSDVVTCAAMVAHDMDTSQACGKNQENLPWYRKNQIILPEEK